MDRIGLAVDFSTSEWEVPSSNPGQRYQCFFIIFGIFKMIGDADIYN